VETVFTRAHESIDFGLKSPRKPCKSSKKLLYDASGRKGRGFESRRLDQKQPYHVGDTAAFLLRGMRRDSRVGAVLREQNALPNGGWITVKLTAKDDVDNVGAGRAAKGANPGRSCFAIPSLRFLRLDQKQPYHVGDTAAFYSLPT